MVDDVDVGREPGIHYIEISRKGRVSGPGSEIENIGVSSQGQIDVNDFQSSTTLHIPSSIPSVCSLCWEQLWREDGAFQDAP